MTQIDDALTSETSPRGDAASAAEDRSYVRRMVGGAVLGFLGVYALIVLMCWLVGITLAAAVGVGAFVALFGGAGFGAMIGGSMEQHRRS